MKKFRYHIARFTTLLVALQILNVGLFFQGFETFATSSSISDNNIINSVVEYVSEVVLEKVDAVPESGNKASHDLQQSKHYSIKLVEFCTESIVFPEISSETALQSSYADNYHYQFCKEITPPPPKA